MASERRAEVLTEYEEGESSKLGVNAISVVMFGLVVAVTTFVALAYREQSRTAIAIAIIGLIVSLIAGLTPRVANEWERGVVLRLGRFTRLGGPGLFFVVPFIDRIVFWMDLRVRTTTFAAEKTLTADTVPVDVDAVLFWHVRDAEQAALRVEDYCKAISWAAQTALRDIIGKTHLADLLTGREAIDENIKKLIDARTHDWGIVVYSVEIRDVVIPASLEDAMSRQAQAEREKQARLILGDAEVEISSKFETAALKYSKNPTAFQLRAMNILYEGMKEKGSLMVVPSNTVESLSIGGMAGLASWGQVSANSGPTTPLKEKVNAE